MAIEIKTEDGAVMKFDTMQELREFSEMKPNDFPEEEESTSGDEGFEADEEDADKPELKFEVGDTVKVLRNLTGGFDAGTIGKVVGIMPWGSLKIESDCGGPYLHPGSTLELVEESELEFKVGDKVRVEGADYHSLGSDIGTIREISEHIRHTHSGRLIPTPYEVTTNTNLGQFVAPEHLELIGEVESEDSEDSEIKAGDIVIATEDEFDITEGVEYEIHEDEDGDRYFLDDIGDIRYVLNNKRRLRKKPTERGFKKGDIVFVNDEFTDSKGETSRRGYASISDSNNDKLFLTYGLFVIGNRSYIEGNEDKLTLVCRAEDRQDK